jgi:hypothetical protein
MTDPAVAYASGEGYDAYERGTDMDIWLKFPNGSYSIGLVWPGPTVYPGMHRFEVILTFPDLCSPGRLVSSECFCVRHYFIKFDA